MSLLSSCISELTVRRAWVQWQVVACGSATWCCLEHLALHGKSSSLHPNGPNCLAQIWQIGTFVVSLPKQKASCMLYIWRSGVSLQPYSLHACIQTRNLSGPVRDTKKALSQYTTSSTLTRALPYPSVPGGVHMILYDFLWPYLCSCGKEGYLFVICQRMDRGRGKPWQCASKLFKFLRQLGIDNRTLTGTVSKWRPRFPGPF